MWKCLSKLHQEACNFLSNCIDTELHPYMAENAKNRHDIIFNNYGCSYDETGVLSLKSGACACKNLPYKEDFLPAA